MNPISLSRSILLLPLFVAVACSNEPPSATDLPPASIGPQLANNTNPPMVAKNASGTLGTIVRLDPALDQLLDPDAKVEILVDGLNWAEGPVWFHGGLLFSDVKQNTIYRWTQEHGVAPYLKPSGYTGTTPRGEEPGSNGLTLDHENRLTLCQHGDRRVVRLEKDGHTVTPLADKYHGMRFSSPNDLIYNSKGDLYFTDPPYGLVGRDQSPAKEMDKNAVYMVRPTGEIKRLNTGDIVYADGKTTPLNFPNGLALSPDEHTFYLCVSDPAHAVYMRYDVQPDGDLTNGKVFFDAQPLKIPTSKGLPDGVKIDNQGNLWAAGPGGILIITPQGKHLGTIATGMATANCAWGDDGSTLYMCADRYICRIKTKARGIMPGAKAP